MYYKAREIWHSLECMCYDTMTLFNVDLTTFVGERYDKIGLHSKGSGNRHHEKARAIDRMVVIFGLLVTIFCNLTLPSCMLHTFERPGICSRMNLMCTYLLCIIMI
jgi:uncharacterized protein (UPF0261 family)